ncbi:MAG: dihydrofolate reductase [Actinomycetia bacterium]|nr:dihydrofolate reductase [Actinomycetes bacterium]
MPHLTAIAAVARNRVIGDGRDLPWHLPEDFARFKRVTMGGALVVGRVTFESFGRPLPGRASIVVTRDAAWTPPDSSPDAPVVAVRTIPEIGRALASFADRTWWCIGGGQVYALMWPYTTRLDLSEVDQVPAGPVLFPVVEPREWRQVSRTPQAGFDLVAYERRDDSAARALAGLTGHAR